MFCCNKNEKILLNISIFICAVSSAQNFKYPFQNPGLPVEQRIENLLGLLTVDEKIGMMMDNSKAVPRLDIPGYGWWNEALHGVARAGTATVFLRQSEWLQRGMFRNISKLLK
jgi:beta-glucosidase